MLAFQNGLSWMLACVLIFNNLSRTNAYDVYTLWGMPLFTLLLLWMQIFLFFILSVQNGCFSGSLIWRGSQDTAGNWGVQKEKKRKKVLKLSLFSCDFFFIPIDSGEFVCRMGVLIWWLNHLRVIFTSTHCMHIIKGGKYLNSIR